MQTINPIIRKSSLAICCGLLLTFSTQSNALQESSVLVDESTSGPTSVPTLEATAPTEAVTNGILVVEEVIPPGAGPLSNVSPAPVVDVKIHRKARRLYACSEGVVKKVVVVDDPCDCTDCLYEVTLCLPSCLVGEPVVCSRVGAFDRGIIEYCWPCGFKAKIVFRRVLGCVVIHYHG